MGRIKNFRDFNIINESRDSLEDRFLLLESSETYHTLNEGKLTDYLKNQLSKAFLGPLSKISMIDKARRVLIDHEIAKIEKRYSIEKEINRMNASGAEKTSISNRREAKMRELEVFNKQQELKIKQAKDYIDDVIDGNQRRQDYFDVGRAEDLIGLAELEYKLAKTSANSNKLELLLNKVSKAKKKAATKLAALKASASTSPSSTGSSTRTSASTATSLAPKPGPKPAPKPGPKPTAKPATSSTGSSKSTSKISPKKASDVIEMKRALGKEIADLKADLERMLSKLEERVKKSDTSPIPKRSMDKMQADFMTVATNLDAKNQLLDFLETLGSSESEISKNAGSKTGLDKIVDQINNRIESSKSKNTGNKKLINDLFQDMMKNPKLDPAKVRNVINKTKRK